MKEYSRDGACVLRYETPELCVVRSLNGGLILAASLTGVTLGERYGESGAFGSWEGVNGATLNEGYEEALFGGSWEGVNGAAPGEGYGDALFGGSWEGPEGVNGAAPGEGYGDALFGGSWEGIDGVSGEPEATEGYVEGGTGSWGL